MAERLSTGSERKANAGAKPRKRKATAQHSPHIRGEEIRGRRGSPKALAEALPTAPDGRSTGLNTESDGTTTGTTAESRVISEGVTEGKRGTSPAPDPDPPDPGHERLLAGLTCGWSPPGDTNHDEHKRLARTMLAVQPERVLAYAEQINAEDLHTGADPWPILAEKIKACKAPPDKYHDRVKQALRNKMA